MIQKLRRKFLLITIILFTSVFTIIAIVYSAYDNYWFYRDTYAQLKWLSSQNNLTESNESLQQCFEFDMSYYGYKPIYVCIISPKNKILDGFNIGKKSKNALDMTIINKVLQAPDKSWKIHSVVFYRKERLDGNTLLIATDCGNEYNGWYVRTTFLLILLSIAAISIIAVCLSRFITRPAQETLLREKRFLSDSGHELKTPLTGLILNLQVLEQKIPNNPEVRHALKDAQQLSKLVQDLLSISIVEERLEDPSDEVFSMSEAVCDLLNGFNSSMALADLKLSKNIAPNVYCRGDRKQIQKMISTILENAIAYNTPNGSIDVSLCSDKKNIKLKISDTGIGISEEDLPHIFERFYMADKSHTGPSTGLGLSIADAISKKYRGKIFVESQLGIGTQVTVILPLWKRR